eukprot:UN00413
MYSGNGIRFVLTTDNMQLTISRLKTTQNNSTHNDSTLDGNFRVRTNHHHQSQIRTSNSNNDAYLVWKHVFYFCLFLILALL